MRQFSQFINWNTRNCLANTSLLWRKNSNIWIHRWKTSSHIARWTTCDN